MNRNKLNIERLGQVFTPDYIIEFMIKLIKNKETVLEPSAGDGYFVKKLIKNNIKNITAIEIDKKLCNKNNFLCKDFFDYSIKNKFNTIIGNPPYVKYNKIRSDTSSLIKNNKEINFEKIFNNRTNLYQYFIYKSIFHLKKNGELIFIVPRDFLKSTSSIYLNKYIFQHGTITDIIELGDKKIFNKANPNVIIFRFEKDNFSRKTKVYQELNLEKFEIKNFIEHKGQLFFLKSKYNINFNDIFYVKVGGVSGADKYFEYPEGQNIVCSYTAKTGKTKKMIYNSYHPYLEQFKNELLKRKLKKFNENNWWEWGRKCYESNEPRIYVNCKTRNKQPFFLNNCKLYDGSILGIFPKKQVDNNTLKKMKDYLNNVNWEELGFFVDGRYIFSQKSLENTLLPDNFKIFL